MFSAYRLVVKKMCYVFFVGIFLFGSSHLYALDLGDMEVRSSTNQKLDLIIDIISATPDEISTLNISLADESVYKQFGVIYSLNSTQYKFSIEGGNGHYFVVVTSSKPILYPSLHLLLDVSWSGGKMVREYTALLEPPLSSGDSVAIISLPDSDENMQTENVQAMQPVTDKTVTDPIVETEQQVNVVWGDTLSGIVTQLDFSVTSVYSAYRAVLEVNPKAFVNGNMNRLLAGATLTIPTLSQINSYDDKVARQLFVKQAKEYEQHVFRARTSEDINALSQGNKAQPNLRISQNAEDDELSTVLNSDQVGQEQVDLVSSNLSKIDEVLLSADAESDQIKKDLEVQKQQVRKVFELLEIEEPDLRQIQLNQDKQLLSKDLATLVFLLVVMLIGIWVYIKITNKKISQIAQNNSGSLVNKAELQDGDTDKIAKDVEANQSDDADLFIVKTALDLAKAYIELGQIEVAKQFIQEVMADGSDEQKREAFALIEEFDLSDMPNNNN